MERVPTACTVYLNGAFRVKLSTGEDVTPNSKVRCALLAVLAASPNQSMSRLRLQTLFWGNSDSKQASGSLRSVLFKLQKDFSSVKEPLFETHSNHVSLVPGRWTVFKSPQAGELLEGLDLCLKGANEFEDWLRDERIACVDEGSKLDSGSIARVSTNHPAPNYALGILPTLAGGLNESAIANSFIDSIIDSIAQLSSISVFDLRGSVLTPNSLPSASTTKSNLLLKSSVHKSGKNWVLRLSLIEPLSGRIVSNVKPIVFEDGDINVDLSHCTEQVLSAFLDKHSSGVPLNLMPWATLASLFSLSPNAVEETEAEIDRLLEIDPLPFLPSLKIFLQIFKQNEGITAQESYQLHDLQNALLQVPMTDTLRPLSESLIGYAAHMLCAENDVSGYLLDTAFKRAPGLAINLDHLAAVHFARGDLKNAVKYHEQCMRFSTLSSWRYSYDITGAMISIALGDYRTALQHSNRSLTQRPQFIGALRYNMIGFAMNDNPENAHQIKSRIETLRPNYDLSNWIESFLRRSNPVFANNVAITLEQLELV